MGASTHSPATIELGKRLVQELGLDDSNDTLSRWMAHYVAEKIEEARSAEGDTKRAAMRECFKAILELWEHRSVFPTGRRPFGDFESLFDTLSSLNIHDSTPRYFRMPRIAATESVVSESQRWLNAATGLDDAARVLIRYCLAVAAENAVDKSRKCVELVQALDRPKGFDIQIVHFLANDVGAMVKTGESDPKREELRRLQERLEAFMSVARSVSEHLKHQLQNSGTATRANKRRRSGDGSAKKSQPTRREGQARKSTRPRRQRDR